MKSSFNFREYFSSKAIETRSFSELDATIYILNSEAACCFTGKKSRPDWNYKFRNTASRDKYVEEYLKGRAIDLAERKAHRDARSAQTHTLKVGDILTCSWGYDQTNVDAYQVTKVISPKMVELRAIETRLVNGEEGFMCGRSVPIKDAFLTDWQPFRSRVGSDNMAKVPVTSQDIDRRHWASPWNGKPLYTSWYA